MWQVFQMTRRFDKAVLPLMILVFVAPIIIAVIAANILAAGNVLTLVLLILIGIFAGVLFTLLVLGKRAETAAYNQMEGQPGASGAVLTSALRRGWITSDTPVAVNKNRDVIFRAIGRGGIVFVVEGPMSRTSRMADDEVRKVSRVVPNVPTHVLHVGSEANQIGLKQIPRSFRSFKRSLTRREVQIVANRLSSLSTGMPIPKGIDPTKIRAGRPR
ncbi:MAG: hypothetical protein RLZZ600_304 [Actinomycetota bacterium]